MVISLGNVSNVDQARSLLFDDRTCRRQGWGKDPMQRIPAKQMWWIGQLALAVAIWCGVALPADAEPLYLSATFSGDGRLENPDDLNILVTVTADSTSNVSNWVIDLAMDDRHPAAALHELYFNLLGSSTDYMVTNVSLPTWSLSGTDVKKAKGSGNAGFMFELDGPNNTVTNGTALSFDVMKMTGLFSPDDFLLAGDGCSRDAALGCGQLGAHIGSLTAAAGQADSGFALGDFSLRTTVAQVPEPGLAAVFGLGVAAFVARRRRQQKSI